MLDTDANSAKFDEYLMGLISACDVFRVDSLVEGAHAHEKNLEVSLAINFCFFSALILYFVILFLFSVLIICFNSLFRFSVLTPLVSLCCSPTANNFGSLRRWSLGSRCLCNRKC